MKMIKDARRYATVEINGVTFTLDKKNPVPCEHILHGYSNIHEAYERPSETKISIWEGWRDWFYMNDGECVISSKNCNFFTVEGWVKDEETNKEYFAVITYANHRLYEVQG